MPQRKKPQERQNIGAMVFLFAQADGQFGLVSYDRKVEVWGRSLDQIWPRYYNKSRRLMAKRAKEEELLQSQSQVSAVEVVPQQDPNGFQET